MERFISEMITVDIESMKTAALVSGTPDCPQRFLWRDKWYVITQLVDQWKRIATDGGKPKGERYVRAHCFRVHTEEGLEAVIYCDRQISKSKKSGWWLYTIQEIPKKQSE